MENAIFILKDRNGVWDVIKIIQIEWGITNNRAYLSERHSRHEFYTPITQLRVKLADKYGSDTSQILWGSFAKTLKKGVAGDLGMDKYLLYYKGLPLSGVSTKTFTLFKDIINTYI